VNAVQQFLHGMASDHPTVPQALAIFGAYWVGAALLVGFIVAFCAMVAADIEASTKPSTDPADNEEV
jgi:uncharacterized membrane protein YphA (DoxX/SURF4 family)